MENMTDYLQKLKHEISVLNVRLHDKMEFCEGHNLRIQLKQKIREYHEKKGNDKRNAQD